MKARVLITIMALAGVLAVSGCSSDNNEHNGLVVSVATVNEGAPFISAAIDLANVADPLDDYVPIDAVTFQFHARYFLTGTVNDPQGPMDSFHITGYDLMWTPIGTAPAELTNYNLTGGTMDLLVTPAEDVVSAVILVPPAMKQEAWYPTAYTDETFQANLEIHFRGHTSGSEHVVIVPATMTVTFLGTISTG